MEAKTGEEWRFRRKQSEAASKSAFAFKINRKLQQKEQTKLSYGYKDVAPYSKEVIVKITGGARSKKGIRNAIEYISEEWQKEIVDSNGIKYKSQREIESAINMLQENITIFSQTDLKKELKLTQNMVFSAPKVASVNKEDALRATIKALTEKYPDNYFVAAYHDETDNPHVHVALNINKDNGDRIDIRKEDLRDIREGYCRCLTEYGYEVKATRKYGTEFKEFKELTKENRNTYEVVDFGTESYKLDDRKTTNNYLVYRTANDKEVTIWGKELLDEITNNKIKIGDEVKIKKLGHTTVKVPVFSHDNATVIDWKDTKRNKWSIGKVGNNSVRLEQQFNKEVELDSLEQSTKQLKQKQEFDHEKKSLLNNEYKENFELKQESGYRYRKHFNSFMKW